jgi:hypothetical protein
MKVALAWWTPTAGGSHQAIRGNTKALLDAGHEVELYLDEMEELAEETHRFDAVVSPHIHFPVDLEDFKDTHLHLQLGGFPTEAEPVNAKETLMKCDTISVLDPSIIRGYLQQHFKVNLADFALIPNPPNRELFQRYDLEEAKDYALVAKLGSKQKPGAELEQIAGNAPGDDFVVHYSGPRTSNIADNVTRRPTVPFTNMGNRYQDARVVLNPSSQDVLPNTAFEAFLTGRPYICRIHAIGDVQSIPRDWLNTSEYGINVRRWIQKYQDNIGEGEHYFGLDENGDMANVVHKLLKHDNMVRKTTKLSDEWLEAWGDWDWSSKGEVLTEVIKNDGPL